MPAPLGHEPYAGCEKGGRPPVWTTEIIEQMADEFIEWLQDPFHVWYKDFCLQKRLNPDLLSEWAKQNEKFGGVYAIARHYQESKLVNGALLGNFNGATVNLVLCNHHDWKNKQETKLSNDPENPVQWILKAADGKSKDLVDGQS